MKRRTVLAASAASIGAMATPAWAQADRPVKILVGFPPGGALDGVARLLADKLKDELKTSVIVDNKPGAGGRLAAELLKNTTPESGPTLMLCPIVVPVLAPLVFSKLNYNPVTDFAPVAHVGSFNFALAVKGDSPYKNLGELVAWMKANPQKAAFGSPAAGSLPHFFGLMVGAEAKTDIVHVPYQGGAPLQTALLGDQVPCGIDVVSEYLANHKAGKLRVLATSGAQRSKVLPDVATFAEQGLPNVVGQGWVGAYATAKAPAAEIAAYNRAINKALAMPDVVERMLAVGYEVGGGSAADLGRRMEADTAKWGPIVRASGFKAD